MTIGPIAEAFVAIHAIDSELAPEVEAQAQAAATAAEATLSEGIAAGATAGGVAGGEAMAAGIVAGAETAGAEIAAPLAAEASAAGAEAGAAAGASFSEGFIGAGEGALAAGSFSKLLGPVIGAAAGIKILGSFVSAAREAGAAQRLLQQSLLNSPAAADVSIQAYNAQADALQNLTGFRNDDIVGVQAQLALYGLTGEQVQKLTPLVLDFAARTGRDVPAAGQVISKALLGMGRALKEVGIRFTDTKTLAGNFQQLIDGLGGSVEGFAHAQLATLGGQLRLLHSNLNDIEGNLGNTLVPILAKTTTVANTFVQGLSSSDKATQGLRQTVASTNPALGFLGAAWRVLSDVSHRLTGNVDKQKAALADATVQVGTQAKALTAGKINLDDFKQSFHDAADTVRKDGGSTADYTSILNEGKSAIHDYLFNLTGLDTQRQIDIQTLINEQVATEALAGGFAGIAADIVQEANAQDALRQAQGAVNKARAAGNIHTAKGIQLQRSLTLAEAAAINAHETTVKALGDLVLSTDKVKAAEQGGTLTTQDVIRVFRDQAEQAHLSAGEIDHLQGKVVDYIRTQSELRSPPVLKFAETGLETVKGRVDALSSSVAGLVQLYGQASLFSAIPTGTRPAPVHPGGGGGSPRRPSSPHPSPSAPPPAYSVSPSPTVVEVSLDGSQVQRVTSFEGQRIKVRAGHR